jgi:precorrin-6A synthase
MSGPRLHLSLIGIGTGNPDHLTRGAEKAIRAADVVLVPRKGAGKEDLAGLRAAILSDILPDASVRSRFVDLPVRDPAIADYPARVEAWHDAIAQAWAEALAEDLARARGRLRVALLVWGDPSLYDSTLRIAARLRPAPDIEVIPGITAIQGLTSAFAIPLNAVGAPVTITTGRRLRAEGFPTGVDTCVVMLDEGQAYAGLDSDAFDIWWAAYVGMPDEIRIHGRLGAVADSIAAARAEARARHGWIMDIYLLRRRPA